MPIQPRTHKREIHPPRSPEMRDNTPSGHHYFAVQAMTSTEEGRWAEALTYAATAEATHGTDSARALATCWAKYADDAAPLETRSADSGAPLLTLLANPDEIHSLTRAAWHPGTALHDGQDPTPQAIQHLIDRLLPLAQEFVTAVHRNQAEESAALFYRHLTEASGEHPQPQPSPALARCAIVYSAIILSAAVAAHHEATAPYRPPI